MKTIANRATNSFSLMEGEHEKNAMFLVTKKGSRGKSHPVRYFP